MKIYAVVGNIKDFHSWAKQNMEIITIHHDNAETDNEIYYCVDIPSKVNFKKWNGKMIFSNALNNSYYTKIFNEIVVI